MVEIFDGREKKEKDRTLVRAYHWTNTLNIPGIDTGGDFLEFDKQGKAFTNPPGLWPRRTIAYQDEQRGIEAKRGPFIFCMMGSACPPEWDKEFALFYMLMHQKVIGATGGLALYSFDVKESDSPLIVDGGSILNYHRNSGAKFDAKWKKWYFESIIPFEEYRGGYTLPELLLPHHIASGRLTQETISEEMSNLLGI